MKHFLSLLTTLIFASPLFAISSDIEDTGIRVVCKSWGDYKQALIVQSDEPMTLKKAKEFFDDRYPYNNGNFPGTIYFFEPFDLPHKDHPEYESKKQKLLESTKDDYVAKYKGRLGSGGYKFGFNSGRSSDVSLWYYLKNNPNNNVRLSVHLDESSPFAGTYTCHHEFFKMKPGPADEILAENIQPDDIYLPDDSATQLAND